MGLSLWQPHASLMAVNAKKIETRNWYTDYRGLVAIHAAKRFQEEERLLLGDKRFFYALSLDYGDEGDKPPTPESVAKALPLGCFVAVGLLRHCLSTTRDAKLIPSEKKDEFWFGDYSPGRFMWVFDDIWKLSSPVYAVGQRRLWTLDEGQKDVIFALLPEEVEQGSTASSLEQAQKR
jgi:activating signal cointegrator 1